MQRALELTNGTLVHHLRILEAREFVKPIRDGFRTRFYLQGPAVVPTADLTRTHQGILETIHANPGVGQREFAYLLGLPRESVFYHSRRLESAGSIRVAQEGNWRRYFPAQPTASATASPV